MRLLRIFTDDKKTYGQFLDLQELNKGTEIEKCYKAIDLIKKEDVLALMNYIMNHTDSELDDYDNDSLQNPAQNLIYNHLSKEFAEIISKKEDIIKSIDKEFEGLEKKYKV